jgi:hypothetical protein
MTTAIKWAANHGVCGKAVEWIMTLPARATMADAWRKCAMADWMLWALHEIKHRSWPGPRHFACDCTEKALLRERAAGREPDPISCRTVEMARAYLDGTATAAEMAAAWAAAVRVSSVASAARASARASAWAAASAAGEAAERRWQADRLRHYVPEWPEVES